MLEERYCKFCGSKLPPTRRSYCNAECAEKALKRMYWEKQNEKVSGESPELDARVLKMPCGCEFFSENGKLVKTKWCLKHQKTMKK